ncbi:MAG: hypothetical protein KJ069_06625 [Anaerolineae bacterium]|nr:hypothetical protein [Anaerolineae bacterium]
MSLLRRHVLLATAVAAAIIALCLYWPIRQFPLSFDDLLHIRLVKGVNYATVWLPTTNSAFFRPGLLLPVLFTRSLFAYYPAPFLYGLNLLLHALNVALLVALAWRLWRRWPRALAAGLLLACYPFSYQVVAAFGNNVYLVLLLLVLLALHTYLRALDKGGWWWPVTAVLFLVGLFNHELMVLFGFYAALSHWAYTGHMEIRVWHWRRSPYLFFLFAAAIYTLLYQFLPLAPSPHTANDLPMLTLLYLGQALVYPLAWLGARLLPDAAPLIITLSLLVCIIWTGLVVTRQPENRLALLLGWGWWGITAVLLFVTLPAYYILHGPRLLYLGSVGVCLLWAVLLDALFSWRRAGKLLWAAALGTMVLIGASFARGRVVALGNLGAPVAVMQAEMASRPLPEGVLLVNLPAWSAPVRQSFPVGAEHVALMGEHVFAEELVWENLNQVRPVRAVAAPELGQEPGYPYGLHVQSPDLGNPAEWASAGATVFINRVTEQGVTTEVSGRFLPADTAVPPLATWGETGLIAGTAVACQGEITAELTWRPAPQTGATTSVFVQALADDGRLLGQADGPPLQLRPDWLALSPGWLITDYRHIQTDGPAVPTTLLIGLYDYVTGERTPGVETNHQPLADNALRLPIQPCP